MTGLVNLLKQRLWLLMTGLAAALALLLWLAPTERTLGQTVKLVYLHGALVRTAVLLFAVSLAVNLVGLLLKKTTWLPWGQAFIKAAILIWLGHTVFSMITTYAAWGIFVAWYEPRTRFTFILAGVSLVVLAAAYVVAYDHFAAVTYALLAGLTVAMLPGLGFIQHPLNPIGTSLSAAIRLYYAAIMLVTVAMGGLLTLWLQTRSAVASAAPAQVRS
jgi:hypothetical protein